MNPTRCGPLPLLAALASLAAGCRPHDQAAVTPVSAETQTPTNRIDIPSSVRRNLGITFATVERRPVRRTVRVPGEFELTPESRREYRSMLAGRVELLVRQYERVETGDVLLRLDAPSWRALQAELAEAAAAIEIARSDLELARAEHDAAVKKIAFMRQRIGSLAEAEVRNVELEAELAGLENDLPPLAVKARARETRLEAAVIHYGVLVRKAAAIVKLPAEDLMESVEHHATAGHEPRGWHAIDTLEIRAEVPGIVDAFGVTNGGWSEVGGLTVRTVDPTALRFRAQALQADIGQFEEGLPVLIVPPRSGSIDLQASIGSTLQVGFRGDPEDRTIPLYAVPAEAPAWARPGVAGYLEVFVEGDSAPELAVPRSCVIQDGLETIMFRRDPADPNKVIRIEADLGVSDGRWVTVQSGVMEGDEIVLDGVYELMLTGGGRGEGGHFHADGTFHAGDH